MLCLPLKTHSSSSEDAATAGISMAGAVPAGIGAAIAGAEVLAGADLPDGMAGIARRIVGPVSIGPGGLLQACIVQDGLLREPIAPVGTDRASAGLAADGPEPADPEADAPAVDTMVAGVLVVAAAVALPASCGHSLLRKRAFGRAFSMDQRREARCLPHRL
jgi:hypothetical protein